MCDPVSITIGVMSMAAQVQAANAASDAQDAAKAESDRAAVQAKVDADRQINLQQLQNDEAAAVEAFNNDLRTKELVASSVVAGGESGAIGNTNNAIIANVMRQGLEANTMVTQNLGRETAQLGETSLGQQSTYQSRINAVSGGAGVSFGQVMGAAAQGAQTGMSVRGGMNSIGKNKAGGGGLDYSVGPDGVGPPNPYG
mgnify:CR=1 FL=1|tara:strand:- start:411 stop:1007 length:597 start_codon:yes stop_codon:yes gene_type:complete